MSTRLERQARPGAANAFGARAHRVIPGGAHTYSRGDDQLPANAPSAFARGKGARVWDLDGVEYVDWGMGINNVLIGHAEDAIDDEAVSALRRGQALSRPTLLEVQLAEAVLDLFPEMDMVKFAKNGSDANTAAVRLARAVTGRDLIGYDAAAPFLSIHDWFIGTTVMRAGVPDAVSALSVPFTFNDTTSVERMFAEHGKRLAIVVLEVCRDVAPTPGFLERLRSLCERNGTILLFDEIVTAFRYHLNGAHAMYGVRPDLLAIGKGMANGYSLSALLGPRELMERGGLRHEKERVFFLSTTNGPEQSALAASLATIRFYQEHDVIARLSVNGGAVMRAVAEASSRHGLGDRLTASSDFACRPSLRVAGLDGLPSPAFRTLFVQELIRAGIFMPWVCPSYRHGPIELERTTEAIDAAATVLARAYEAGGVEQLLDGEPAKPVFRRFN